MMRSIYFAAIFLLAALPKFAAAADDLSGTWISNSAAGQRTLTFSKTGEFKITIHDISELPEDKKFPDRVQTGSWKISGNNSPGTHLGTFGKQKRIYLKFTADQKDKVQGYKYKLFLLDGVATLELDGPGIFESFGDELGLFPKPNKEAALAEQAGGFYQAIETQEQR